MRGSVGRIGVDRLTEAELRDSRSAWWSARLTALLREKLAPIEEQTILDFGCGTGILAEKLRSTAPGPSRVLGIDVDLGRIRRAREAVAAAGEEAPFRDATFSATATILTLQHVPDPLAVLAEVGRVTRPGGLVLAVGADNLSQRLYVSTGDAALEESYSAFWKRVATANPDTHFRLGPRLLSLFIEAGFERCQVEGFLATHWRFADPKAFFDGLRRRMDVLADRYGVRATEEHESILDAVARCRKDALDDQRFYVLSSTPLFVATGRVRSGS